MSKKLINWIRYSGAVVTLIINPLYWKIYPWVGRSYDFYDKPRYEFKFLFITITVWVDDGDW